MHTGKAVAMFRFVFLSDLFPMSFSEWPYLLHVPLSVPDSFHSLQASVFPCVITNSDNFGFILCNSLLRGCIIIY